MEKILSHTGFVPNYILFRLPGVGECHLTFPMIPGYDS